VAIALGFGKLFLAKNQAVSHRNPATETGQFPGFRLGSRAGCAILPPFVESPMTLQSYSKDGILTVLFTDSRLLDESKLEQLGGDLIAQLNDTTEERVILDFRSVQFMSSSMLGKLVQVQKKCKEFKVHLKLCAITPDIKQVFKITKLDRLFEIEDDEASARKAFMKRGWFG
jgi:anti-anti-sigma factor